jgi:hypothetical protein
MATPDLVPNIPGQQTPSPAKPVGGRPTGAADEPNLGELLDYHAVPFKRTMTMAVRYLWTARMKPRPFPLHEAEAEKE